MLGEDGFFEGKVNYGSQSTWLKYQGHHTVIGPLCACCVKVPFFIALCLFWRLDPFGIHLLTLKCLCWQELGSLWCGAGELRRGRQWRQTEQCVCACVYSKGLLLVVMHMHSAHLSNRVTLGHAVMDRGDTEIYTNSICAYCQ